MGTGGTGPHALLADLFFKHIAEHGRFHEAQLYRFVELKGGGVLSEFERSELLGYARVCGAVREAKSIAPMYQLPKSLRISRRKVKNDRQLELGGVLGEARLKPACVRRRA